MLFVSLMKGCLICSLGLLALCTAMFMTSCAEGSGWSTNFSGLPVQETGKPSTEPPPGSGSVDYVPQGPFQ
jgi:hypothetical protein